MGLLRQKAEDPLLVRGRRKQVWRETGRDDETDFLRGPSRVHVR